MDLDKCPNFVIENHIRGEAEKAQKFSLTRCAVVSLEIFSKAITLLNLFSIRTWPRTLLGEVVTLPDPAVD